ncbi:MAG: type II toxin-antitoxin system HicA family toxin [Acidobacteriota bacterium]
MKVRDLLKRLAEDGWIDVKGGKGSHRKFTHPTKPGYLTVAFHSSNADIAIGTLKSILRAAGLDWESPMKYAIVIERGPTGYGATVPDLPGCVAVGDSLEDVQRLIREAIDQHVAFLRELGQPIPAPATDVAYVDVA